jgi:predicted SnoaL-like aldol condensation-catalyzing enzyme
MTSTLPAQPAEAERKIAQAERNKETIRRCYEEFFGKGNLDAAVGLIHEDFVQHSPDSPSGRDAYLEHLRHAAFAGGTSRIHRIIAEGEYVVVHHHMTLPGDDGRGMAVVDLWRLEDGLVVEHWDIEQPIPEPEHVPNGML